MESKENYSPQTIEKKQLKEHSPKIFSTLSDTTSRGEGSLLTGGANFRDAGRLFEGVLKLKKYLLMGSLFYGEVLFEG